MIYYGKRTENNPLIYIITLFSCTEEIDSVAPLDQDVTYRGLKLKHTGELPVQTLQSGFDVEQVLVELMDKQNIQTNISDLMVLRDLNTLSGLVIEKNANYPDLTQFNELTIAKIQENFPELDEEGIKEHWNDIVSYYESNLKYDLMSEIAEEYNLPIPNSGRVEDSDFLSINSCEVLALLNSYPQAAIVARNARDDAFEAAEANYPDMGTQHTKRDAFRHGYWCALMVKRYAENFKLYHGPGENPKTHAFWFAHIVSGAHETCHGSDTDMESTMDYRNNFNGIEHGMNTVGVSGKWPFRSVSAPPEIEYLEFMRDVKVVFARFVTSQPEIWATDVYTMVYYVQ